MNQITLDGKVFYHNTTEYLMKLIHHEIWVQEQYKQGLEEAKKVAEPTIIDCGAHIGFATLYFNQIPNVRIYSIEANPNNFEALKENTKKKENIKIFNYALGAYIGKRTLSGRIKEFPSESLYQQGESKIEVEGTTLRQIIIDNKIENVDVMKIDVEGAEYEIFPSRSFRDIEHKIKFIIGESHMDVGLPMFIPSFLPNYDVEFLDVYNLSQQWVATYPNGENVQVNIPIKSLFIAKRKDNL